MYIPLVGRWFASTPAKSKHPVISTKRIYINLSFPPTRETIQDFESDWQIYGPGELTLTLCEQKKRGAEWTVEGLDEQRFDAVADVVEKWVESGRCVKAWMEEEGGIAETRRWDLKV